VHAVRRLTEQRIATVLNAALSSGQVKRGFDVEHLAVLVHSCLMGFFVGSLGEPLCPEPGELAERVVTLVFLGLVSPETNALINM
jgi:TetR/AcrR family transcriptional regulator, acrAB operon repressor